VTADEVLVEYLQKWGGYTDRSGEFHRARREVVRALRGHSLTYAQIGDRLGVTRQRAQQLGAEE
jgi:DNA-directed RNA polymerase sigma subunit (sigma70/sigma32)